MHLQICTNAAGKSDGLNSDRKVVKKVLCQLISRHYVERAPPADLPAPTAAVHANATTKRGSMSASAKASADQAENVRRLDQVSIEATVIIHPSS